MAGRLCFEKPEKMSRMFVEGAICIGTNLGDEKTL